MLKGKRFGINITQKTSNMAFKMKGSPMARNYGPPFKHSKEQEYPGNNNPDTPTTLYTSDGKPVSTATLNEGELGASTKTDSIGRHAQHSNGTKYYFSKPK